MTNDLKSRILENLVAGRAGQFQFLAELVKTPSENPPGDCREITELTAKALKKLDFGVERHAAAAETGDDSSGQAGAAGGAEVTNLVVRHEFGSGHVVALVAHGDTRPAGEGWTSDPFGGEIQDGVLHGLGALTKADFAAYAYALLALRDARPELSGTVELHFTFDGQTGGGSGPGWLLANGAVNPDYAIGSGLAYGIGTSAMGDLHLEVETETRTAGRAPGADGGVDALEAAGRVMAALYGLRGDLGKIKSEVPGIGAPELVIGEIEGGSRPDRAPRRVVFRLGRRLIPDEDPAAVEAALTHLIADTASRCEGIVCRIRRLKLSPPLKPGHGTDKLAGCLERHAARVFGREISTTGIPYDPDARHYAAIGIPTVLYGAGPATWAEAGAGGPGERLVLDDLRKATEVIALTLADFLGASLAG